MGVKQTQSNVETLKKLKAEYAENATGLTNASQVIALNFKPISAAIITRNNLKHTENESL